MRVESGLHFLHETLVLIRNLKKKFKNQPTRFSVALFSFCQAVTENLGANQNAASFSSIVFELRLLCLKILQIGRVHQNMQKLIKKSRITMN